MEEPLPPFPVQAKVSNTPETICALRRKIRLAEIMFEVRPLSACISLIKSNELAPDALRRCFVIMSGRRGESRGARVSRKLTTTPKALPSGTCALPLNPWVAGMGTGTGTGERDSSRLVLGELG